MDIWRRFPLHHDIVERLEVEVHHINLLIFLAHLTIVEYLKGVGEKVHKATMESIIVPGTWRDVASK
jgi:hypothetical protein